LPVSVPAAVVPASPRSAFHDSGNKSQRNNCASVAESSRSFFSLAEAIAFTRCGCTHTSRATSGSTISRNAGQNPQASTATCTVCPRNCRKYRRNANRSLFTGPDCIVLPLASNTVM
jgi:hypothetical protein